VRGSSVKRGLVLLLVTILAGLKSQAVAMSPRHWVSFGPDGGPMASLAVDPFDPATVYAGSAFGAAYKSWNGSARWHPMRAGLPDVGFGAMAVDPFDQDTLYAGTEGEGVFKSSDGGASWTEADTGIPHRLRFVSDLVVDPSSPGTLYAAVGEDEYAAGSLFASTDAAANWAPVTLPGVARALAVDPTDPSRIFAGIWRSEDRGATWSIMTFDDGCQCGTPTAFAFDPDDSGVMFAGLDQGLIYEGSVQRSVDHGVTWDEVLSTDPVESMAAAEGTGGTPSALYVGTGQYATGQVHKSIDGGDTWSTVSAGLPTGQVLALAVDPYRPTTLYAALSDGGVSKTTDAGTEWRISNAGLNEEFIHALAVGTSNPSIVYAGTDVYLSGNGIHRGSRHGRRWGPISPGHTYDGAVKAIAVDPTDPNRLFVGMNDYCDACDHGAVEVSIDGGLTWTDVSPDDGPVEDVAIDPFDQDTVFTASVFSNTGMYRSFDGGATWEGAGPDVSYVTALEMDPSTQGVLYAGTADVGVYKSTDGGTTWLGTGLPPVSVTDLALNPSDPPVLYATAFPGSVWRTDDGGQTWVEIDDQLPDGFFYEAVAVDPLDANHAFVGTFGAGVYETTDGGATWSSLSDGLGDLWVAALAVDATGRFLYAGTGGPAPYGPGGDGVFQVGLG
jgi:photosystem II stability/assembly factor-like uncharacterized protein